MKKWTVGLIQRKLGTEKGLQAWLSQEGETDTKMEWKAVITEKEAIDESAAILLAMKMYRAGEPTYKKKPAKAA